MPLATGNSASCRAAFLIHSHIKACRKSLRGNSFLVGDERLEPPTSWRVKAAIYSEPCRHTILSANYLAHDDASQLLPGFYHVLSTFLWV